MNNGHSQEFAFVLKISNYTGVLVLVGKIVNFIIISFIRNVDIWILTELREALSSIITTLIIIFIVYLFD